MISHINWTLRSECCSCKLLREALIRYSHSAEFKDYNSSFKLFLWCIQTEVIEPVWHLFPSHLQTLLSDEDHFQTVSLCGLKSVFLVHLMVNMTVFSSHCYSEWNTPVQERLRMWWRFSCHGVCHTCRAMCVCGQSVLQLLVLVTGWCNGRQITRRRSSCDEALMMLSCYFSAACCDDEKKRRICLRVGLLFSFVLFFFKF